MLRALTLLVEAGRNDNRRDRGEDEEQLAKWAAHKYRKGEVCSSISRQKEVWQEMVVCSLVLWTQTLGEEPNDKWLEQEHTTVPAGSEVHLIERMLFRVPKVTFGSVSNGAFDVALDITAAITAERFRTWWTQETRDVVQYISHAGEALVQLSASIKMIMALERVERMIVYHRAIEGEGVTTVYEKDHTEKTLAGWEPCI